MDLFDYLLELSQKGYFCAQILIKLALELDGKEDADLVRAMSGLNGGLGFCGRVCGALTGGCAALGYFAGKGEDEELESCELKPMIAEYVAWFGGYCEKYGGCDCDDILQGDPSRKMSVCPQIVADCYDKLIELLQNHRVIE